MKNKQITSNNINLIVTDKACEVEEIKDDVRKIVEIQAMYFPSSLDKIQLSQKPVAGVSRAEKLELWFAESDNTTYSLPANRRETDWEKDDRWIPGLRIKRKGNENE